MARIYVMGLVATGLAIALVGCGGSPTQQPTSVSSDSSSQPVPDASSDDTGTSQTSSAPSVQDLPSAPAEAGSAFLKYLHALGYSNDIDLMNQGLGFCSRLNAGEPVADVIRSTTTKPIYKDQVHDQMVLSAATTNLCPAHLPAIQEHYGITPPPKAK